MHRSCNINAGKIILMLYYLVASASELIKLKWKDKKLLREMKFTLPAKVNVVQLLHKFVKDKLKMHVRQLKAKYKTKTLLLKNEETKKSFLRTPRTFRMN